MNGLSLWSPFNLSVNFILFMSPQAFLISILVTIKIIRYVTLFVSITFTINFLIIDKLSIILLQLTNYGDLPTANWKLFYSNK